MSWRRGSAAGARALVLSMLVGTLLVVTAGTASAACHAFTVTVDPSTVTEGGKVSATVTRDGDLAASNIDISTIDETAKAPGDYTAIHETIQFGSSGSGDLSRSITISTKNDSIHETNETFRVHLSNPGGCAVNPNYDVGPDARVTIKDNDTAPSHSSTPVPSKKPSASATASAKSTVTPTSPIPTSTAKPSPRVSRSTAPSSTAKALAAGAGTSRGGSGGLVALVVVVALLGAGASGYFVTQRRRRV